MPRLNWQQRQGPQDFDDTAPSEVSYQFDYRHKGGSKPWPERHRFSGVKFGPALIRAAWKSGLVVLAEIEGFDHPVAVTETRWNAAKCFEVKSLEGWRLPLRIFTRTDTRGLRSTGEWIEPID